MAFYPSVSTFTDQQLAANGELEIALPAMTPGPIVINVDYAGGVGAQRSIPRNRTLARQRMGPGLGGVVTDVTDIFDVGPDDPIWPQQPVTGITTSLYVQSTLIGSGVDHIATANGFQSNKFRIVLRNQQQAIKTLNVLVSYTSNIPILSKTIPLGFFRQAFDSMWNEVQPIKEIKIDNNKFSIRWDDALKDSLPLPSVFVDMGDIGYGPISATIRGFKSTQITFSVEGKLSLLQGAQL